jgi:serine/threonine protein kinase
MSTLTPNLLQTTLSKIPDSQSLLLADVCEDFLRRTEQGDAPSLEEYVDRFPGIASLIRDVVPALGLFERVQRSGTTAPRKPQPLPTSVAGCQILRQLGAGAMGIVYEAIHPSVSRRLAIKVLRHHEHASAKIHERFLIEAEAASRLNHPNIVPFVDFGCDNGRAYLSMLYIEGTSLDHVLDSIVGPSSEADSRTAASKARGQVQRPDIAASAIGKNVLDVSSEICSDYRKLAALGAAVASALAHAHSMRVVHRDIKPGNLILDNDGKIWVTDFGLAKIHNDDNNLSRTGDMIGTPRYMAPEQIRGVCSTHSDFFALGVTLYELASKKRAWEAISRSQLLTARSSLDLPHLLEVAPDVPPGLAKIIMKACAFRPEDRYETADELELVLRRFADGHAEGDRRNRERVEGEKFVRRKPVYFTVALLALTIIGAIGTNVYLKYAAAQESPTEFLAVLKNEEFLDKIVKDLPDANGNDTDESRAARMQTAGRAQEAIEKTIDSFVVDTGDKNWVNENVQVLTDAYSDGKISREDTRKTIERIQSSNVISLMRFQNAMRQLKKSNLSESSKQTGFAILEELCLAIMHRRMQQSAITQLKDQLPPREGTVAQTVIDTALKPFLAAAYTALNAVEGMPKGMPGSKQRYDFLITEDEETKKMRADFQQRFNETDHR